MSSYNIGVVANAVTIVTAFAALIFAFFQLRAEIRAARRQAELQQSAGQASMLLEMAHEWNRIYGQRNAVLSMNIDLDAIKAKYADAPNRYFLTEEWATIREVANFYNYCGLIIWKKYIDPQVLFVLVTLDQRIYDKLEPLILWLKAVYRPDIYDFFLWLRPLKLGSGKQPPLIKPLRPAAAR